MLGVDDPTGTVSDVYSAATTELTADKGLIVGGIVSILAVAWGIRAVWIANKTAKKAAAQVGS